MTTVVPAPTTADRTADLLHKLSLESKKDGAVTGAAKKSSGMPYGSSDTAALQVDRSITPLLQEAMDPNFFYQPNAYASPAAYYYPSGYEGSTNEWDPRYTGHEGMEVPPSVYGDMYHGYGYAPYGPYPSGSPVPSVGHDGQSYATQQYQYPQYYQPPTPTNPTHGVNGPNSQSALPHSVASHQARIVVDTTKIGANGSATGMLNHSNSAIPRKQNHLNGSVASNGSYGRGTVQGGGSSASSYSHNGLRSPVQWYDGPIHSNGHQRQTTSSTSYRPNTSSAKSHSQRPTTNLMGMHGLPSSGMGLTSSYPSRMYPDSRVYGQYGQYGSTLNGGLGFGSNVYNSRNNARWGVVETKYKPRGRAAFGFGSENQDGFTELNRGPRSGGFKHQKQFGPTVTIAVKGQAIPSVGKQENVALPDKSQFNQEGFPVTYKDAKFFVIKSYSEDDVHKSIKYNVWASTPNGNKKLDAGYREAQEDNDCPVFLFFSVNTSGQFVGIAEMVGPVDFEKTLEYWQQDKWNGCFPLKWHIIKDVPNNILKHITLDNNDNKPVTNSRDTQEVKLEQGLEMLKIFKENASKTSILDDFGFYESRQKLMQEKRAKQQPLQGQGGDVSHEKDKDAANGKPGVQKQPSSNEGALAREAVNTSKPAAESGVSNSN